MTNFVLFGIMLLPGIFAVLKIEQNPSDSNVTHAMTVESTSQVVQTNPNETSTTTESTTETSPTTIETTTPITRIINKSEERNDTKMVPRGMSDLKIQDGGSTEIRRYPWMGSMQRMGEGHKCAAVLISDDKALTSAHCIILDPNAQPIQTINFHDPANYTYIMFGITWLNETSNTTQIVQVMSGIVHKEARFDIGPDFFHRYEIGAVTFKPVKFNEAIRPMRLIPTSEAGKAIYLLEHRQGSCRIAGWGCLIVSGAVLYPDSLRQAKVRIIDNPECCKLLYTFGNSCMSQIEETGYGCFVPKNDNASSCKGDAGGPIVCEYHGSRYVVGIILGGFKGTNRFDRVITSPGLYLRYNLMTDFIKQLVKPVSYSKATSVTQIGTCIILSFFISLK